MSERDRGAGVLDASLGAEAMSDAERISPAPAVRAATDPGATLLDSLELPVEVRLGRLTWTLGRVLELRLGDAVPVGPEGDDTVTLHVQGRPYATGDLVVVEGRFAFRVRELCAGADQGEGR